MGYEHRSVSAPLPDGDVTASKRNGQTGKSFHICTAWRQLDLVGLIVPLVRRVQSGNFSL